MPKMRTALARMSLVCLALIGVSGCASGPATSCLAFEPIRPTGADVATMSDVLAGQILAHNEAGAAVCGWER